MLRIWAGVLPTQSRPGSRQFSATPLSAAVDMLVPDWMYPNRLPLRVVYGHMPGEAIT